MGWQEDLQQLDAELAAGRIDQHEHRRRRDDLLAEASSGAAVYPSTPRWQSTNPGRAERPRTEQRGRAEPPAKQPVPDAAALLRTDRPTTAPSPADAKQTDAMAHPSAAITAQHTVPTGSATSDAGGPAPSTRPRAGSADGSLAAQQETAPSATGGQNPAEAQRATAARQAATWQPAAAARPPAQQHTATYPSPAADRRPAARQPTEEQPTDEQPVERPATEEHAPGRQARSSRTEPGPAAAQPTTPHQAPRRETAPAAPQPSAPEPDASRQAADRQATSPEPTAQRDAAQQVTAPQAATEQAAPQANAAPAAGPLPPVAPQRTAAQQTTPQPAPNHQPAPQWPHWTPAQQAVPQRAGHQGNAVMTGSRPPVVPRPTAHQPGTPQPTAPFQTGSFQTGPFQTGPFQTGPGQTDADGEQFPADAAAPEPRTRRKPTWMFVSLGLLLVLAAIIGGAWWLGGESGQPATQPAGQAAPAPPQLALEERLPPLPGQPAKDSSTMSVERGAELGLYSAEAGVVFTEHGATEVIYRGSGDGPDGYLVLVVPTADRENATAVADYLEQTALASGFTSTPVAGDTGVTGRNDAGQLSGSWYVSDEKVVSVWVSQPLDADETMLTPRLERTIDALRDPLPAG